MTSTRKSIIKKTATKKPTAKKLGGKASIKKIAVKKTLKKAVAKVAVKNKPQVVAQSSSKAMPAAKILSRKEKITPPATPITQISPAERMKMIAETAYYLAEARGFSQGNDVDDWVVAEQQVNAKLNHSI